MKKVVIISLIILTILSISFSIVYATNTVSPSNNTDTNDIENSTNNVNTLNNTDASNIEDATNNVNIINNTDTSDVEDSTNNVNTTKTYISNSVSESKDIKIKTSMGGKNFYVYLDDKEYELYQENGFFYNTNKHFSNSDEMIKYLQENYTVEEIK